MAQGVKLNEDVLPVEQFKAWREEGLSFDAIGERIDYAGGTVRAYGRRVLPERLQGRRLKKPGLPTPLERLERIKREIHEERVNAENRKRREIEEEKKERAIKKRLRAGLHKKPVVDEPAPQPPVEVGLVPAEESRVQAVPTGAVFALGSLHGPVVITALCGVADAQYLAERGGDSDAWHDFLFTTDIRLPEFKGLLEMTPPPYVRTDDDRLMYLRYIAAGRVWMRGGRRVRRRLRRILAEIGHPVLGLGTVRLLDVLASAALWLIKREG